MRHPDFAPALKLEGMLLEESGHAGEAGVAYEKGLKLAPSDPDLLFKVGVYKLISGKNEEAIALLKQNLRIEPKDGDALYYLAQAYHLTGHDDLALKAIRECLEYKANDAAVWQKYGELLCSSGDNETGLQWLLKAKQANSRLERIDFDLGVASMNTMKLEDASAYAEAAARAHPEDQDALELLASVQVKLSKWQDAAATYTHLLALKPEMPDALLGLGRCQLGMRQYQASVDTLNHLLQIDPAAILAHYYLAKAYAGLGNAGEAQHQSDLHQAMMAQTSFSPSALGTVADKAVWAQARSLLEAHHEDEALKLFEAQEKDAAAAPGHPYFLVGALYLYMGNVEDGVRNLHRALQLQPKVRGPHTYLGIYNMQRGSLGEAEKEFKAEITNDPNYETAIAELGLVYYKQQRWADAAEQIAKSHTRSSAILLALCDAYFHLGREKDADLTAEIAAAYAHDDPELINGLVKLLQQNGQNELAQRLSGGSEH